MTDTAVTFRLERDAFGRLVFHPAEGEPQAGVVPVRAFPLAAPTEGISLVNGDGREVAWIDRLSDLAPDQRALIEAEIASREVTPVVSRLVSVSSFSTPCTWEVETDRGRTHFLLKGEEDIRRLAGRALLIASGQGLNFLIRDAGALDRSSRKLLERFL